MTLIYERPPSVQRGTHVLAIGVGRYPHLIGGSGPLAENPLGLKQLSSPPASTKALLDWCLSPLLNATSVGFTNSDSPLASVEAVVSSTLPLVIATPSGSQQLEPATRDNIQQAFERWLLRLKANDANVGVFYFCGHGVMVSDHYLLAEDFGHDPGLPWDRAFDISNTLRAVEREVKGALYFFIDACREVARDVALTLGANPNALRAVNLRKPVVRGSVSLIEATGEGKLAFSIEGGKVSRFTEALLTALSGYCGTKRAGSAEWEVDGESIAAAVRKLLDNGNLSTERRQLSDQTIGGASVALLKVTVVPKVKVALDLLPPDFRAVAKLYLKSIRGDHFEHDGANGMLQTEVPRGFYAVGAKPAVNQFQEILFDDQDLVPPLFDLIMRVPEA